MDTPQRFSAGAVDLGALSAQNHPGATQAPSATPGSQDVYLSLQVSMETFESELVARSTQIPVVVLVGSSRSDASTQLFATFTPIVNAQGTHVPDVKWLFRYIDADATPEIAQALGVQGLPTVIALAGGSPITSFQGGQAEDALKPWIDALVTNTDGKLAGLPADSVIIATEDDGAPAETVDPRRTEAEDLLGSGEYDKALEIYTSLLQEDPKNLDLQAALAQAELLSRTSQEVDSSTDDLLSTADSLLLAGDRDQAAGVLLDLIEQGGETKSGAQQRLIDMLKLYDSADPFVKQTRQRLASLLY